MPNATILRVRATLDLVEARVLAEPYETRRHEAWAEISADLLAAACEADERIEELEDALLFTGGVVRPAPD